jgi:hypothetical protein
MHLPIQAEPVMRGSDRNRYPFLSGVEPAGGCLGLGKAAQVCWRWDSRKKSVCAWAEVAGVKSGETCIGKTMCQGQGFNAGFVKVLWTTCVDLGRRRVCRDARACFENHCLRRARCAQF